MNTRTHESSDVRIAGGLTLFNEPPRPQVDALLLLYQKEGWTVEERTHAINWLAHLRSPSLGLLENVQLAPVEVEDLP